MRKVRAIVAERIFLCRSASRLYAMRDACSHQDLSLGGARVRLGVVMCPHDGARFSLEDGRSLSPLPPNGITLLLCSTMNGALEIEL
jgi:3-phenylpropionate/trans-cinnamate dioxygenase ferredoxin component